MSVTFKDIHAMIAAAPALPTAKNTTSDLAALAERLQGCCHPEIRRPRAAFYASAYRQADIALTQAGIASVAQPGHGVQKFCAKLNADLRVYELNLTEALPVDGLKEAEAAHLIAYGLMAVEEHVDCLMIGSLSIGFKAAREAFAAALAAQPDADVFALAARHGGQDMCALLGALLSARMAKIPVVAGQHTGNVLQAAADRLFGAGDSTLVIASANDVAEPVRVLQYVYQTVGDLIAAETVPKDACPSACAA